MWPLRWVASTGSTNADLAEAARRGAAEGVAVATEHQSAGRGRLGRTWQAPPGTSVAVSFLLRPDGVPVTRWSWLPLLIGVAVAEAVDSAAGVQAVLKWPNDVLVEDGKLAGILVDHVDTPTGPAVVAGVGINLRQDADQLPPGATSLRREAGTDVAASDLVERLAGRLENSYSAWCSVAGAPSEGLRPAYLHRCDTVGRDVRADMPGASEIVGRATDVDEFGRLVISTDAGAVTVGAGDIVHLRSARDAPNRPPHMPGC